MSVGNGVYGMASFQSLLRSQAVCYHKTGVGTGRVGEEKGGGRRGEEMRRKERRKLRRHKETLENVGMSITSIVLITWVFAYV